MKRLKRWVISLLMLCLILLSAGFALWNTQAVPLSFGLFSFDARPLSVWIIISFSLGAIFGLVLGAGMVRHIQSRHRIKQLEQELSKRPKFGLAERAERD
jgi:uncharacterized integral membrane protein